MSALYRPFDVVAVAIGEGGDSKRRPALVVSTPEFERSTGLVWVAMITVSDKDHRFGDIPVAARAIDHPRLQARHHVRLEDQAAAGRAG
jgi:hypothetical protein